MSFGHYFNVTNFVKLARERRGGAIACVADVIQLWLVTSGKQRPCSRPQLTQ